MTLDAETDSSPAPGRSGPALRHNLESPSGQGTLVCMACRTRKLKCDRAKPACGRCAGGDNHCVYPESKRKLNFKRRNVKELAGRITQLEDHIKEVARDAAVKYARYANLPTAKTLDSADTDRGSEEGNITTRPLSSFHSGRVEQEKLDGHSQVHVGQIIDGYNEFLPAGAAEELSTLYFHKNYAQFPIIHPGRFWRAFYDEPPKQPPKCLMYAMWALAVRGSQKYDQYAQVLYKHARHYAEQDERRNHGEHFISVQHAQAYALVATYEAKCSLFTRGVLSAAKSVRLIATRLPASEGAFLAGTEEQSPFLEEVFQGATYSGFSGIIVVCRVYKDIMFHAQKSSPQDPTEDTMNDACWTRNRKLDNELSTLSLCLPDGLQLPKNARDPDAVQFNLNLQACIICLHHAAIERAGRFGQFTSIREASLVRLKAAAEQIVNTIRLISHNTALLESPLSALSLYCAISVYIYFANGRTDSCLTSIEKADLLLLFQCMEAMGRSHEITQGFLRQACLDVGKKSLSSTLNLPGLRRYENLDGEVFRISIKGPRSTPSDPISQESDNRHIAKNEETGPGMDCFQPILGAVRRNIAGPGVSHNVSNPRQEEKQARLGLSFISHKELGTAEQTADSNCGNGKTDDFLQTGVGLGLPYSNNITVANSSDSVGLLPPCPYASYGGANTQYGSANGASSGISVVRNDVGEGEVGFQSFQAHLGMPLWRTPADDRYNGGTVGGDMDWASNLGTNRASVTREEYQLHPNSYAMAPETHL